MAVERKPFYPSMQVCTRSTCSSQTLGLHVNIQPWPRGLCSPCATYVKEANELNVGLQKQLGWTTEQMWADDNGMFEGKEVR